MATQRASSSVRKWHVDLSEGENGGASASALCDPIGYNASVAAAALKEGGIDGVGALGSRSKEERDVALKEQKAWEFAQASVKQVGMVMFMMYMSGNSVHIFSMMMTFAGVSQPFMAIYNSGKQFEKFKDPQGRVNVFAPRMLYCLIQMSGLAFALYKLAGIGFLPTHLSDWVSSIPTPTPLEYSATSGTN